MESNDMTGLGGRKALATPRVRERLLLLLLLLLLPLPHSDFRFNCTIMPLLLLLYTTNRPIFLKL